MKPIHPRISPMRAEEFGNLSTRAAHSPREDEGPRASTPSGSAAIRAIRGSSIPGMIVGIAKLISSADLSER